MTTGTRITIAITAIGILALIIVGVCAKGCVDDIEYERIIKDEIAARTKRVTQIDSELKRDMYMSLTYQEVQKDVDMIRYMLSSSQYSRYRDLNQRVNLDTLLATLTSLPVIVEEIHITEDWLTSKAIDQKTYKNVVTYNSVTYPVPVVHRTNKTNTRVEQRAKKIWENQRSWSKDECMRIAQNYIWIGMSREQLIVSRGHPRRINTSVGAWGRHEQFVYGDYGLYIYIENGEVTAWQN